MFLPNNIPLTKGDTAGVVKIRNVSRNTRYEKGGRDDKNSEPY